MADAEKYMWLITPEILMSTVPIVDRNRDNGVEFRLIRPRNVKYPPGFKSRPSEHLRLTGEIKISMVMTEKSAGFCLPGRDGKIDFSIAFFSRGEEFHKWCKDLFLYYWEKARPARGL